MCVCDNFFLYFCITIIFFIVFFLYFCAFVIIFSYIFCITIIFLLLLGWLLLGWLLLEWLVLSNFEQVNNLVVILMTLTSQKNNRKTPVGETGCLCIFFPLFLDHCLMSPALHPVFSDLWGSPPALSSTQHLAFFWMFRHPVF